MNLTNEISKRNFKSLLWHAAFVAIAKNFIDVDTVIPSMMVDAGGAAVHIGILTAIMLGGATFTQLFFAPVLSNFEYKRNFLLTGINLRVLSLLLLGVLLYYSANFSGVYTIVFIYLLITMFSLGGAFANISYMDILGKSILEDSRKPFFSIRQVIASIALLASVFVARYVLKSNEYPYNYSLMLFIGFMALAIASLGFWNLKEVTPSKLTIKGPRHFGQMIRLEMKTNKKLTYFLGFINTQGVSITFLPFTILYAKENMNLGSEGTGDLLVFKVLGMVLTGVLLYILKGKFRYKYLLYMNTTLALLLPFMMLAFPLSVPLYIIFLIGGIIFSSYNISVNGVLLEVSGTGNRALYTGLVGAGNIIPAVFPLVSGGIIAQLGFQSFFIVYALIIVASFYFIYKMDCKK